MGLGATHLRVRGQGRSEGTLQRAGSQVTEMPMGRVGREGRGSDEGGEAWQAEGERRAQGHRQRRGERSHAGVKGG